MKKVLTFKSRIYKYWDSIRSSFWFLPVIMSAGAMLLAGLTTALDESMTDWFRLTWGWKLGGGAEGASAVMAALTGSMITITGVVFSMTLVALSLTSSQFGPRLLRNFMRDTTTQVVLGTFISTFLYCLIVLRTIKRADGVSFVPHLSVLIGVFFAVVSVGVLIYFIHHVSVSIQANEIVARVGNELIEGIDRLIPERTRQEKPPIEVEPANADLLETFHQESRPVGADGDGYIQFIDHEALMGLAVEEDIVIRIASRPGHYVVTQRPLVQIWPGNRISDQLKHRVNLAFALGRERIPRQDIEFLVNQLVEIAVRALSPGLNDPFTAIACVDRLGSALSRMVQRDAPPPYLRDEQDKLRIITAAVTFPIAMDTAFNQIRQYGFSSASVTISMLKTIATIAIFAYRPEDRAAILRHAEMIARGAEEGLHEEFDRLTVQECHNVVNHVLQRDCSMSGKSFREISG